MRKILEDFYYGNITPCDQQMAPDSEMKRAVNRVSKMRGTVGRTP